ncbi:SGNH/GDSL hydrolase family protein [Pedobacter agri]|uniref:SGNH/GDSL hydrolase family protein n=1 Tax=Pedobacter agri TaxID=454586 RepID=A0A9X3IA58_9SPHI|nr:SGNH/GDSL hydrolase family protein [Pedobacter agri]MCX3266531.1 SGNH/GDSL hydrolase family protein [Pedobacter agri]
MEENNENQPIDEIPLAQSIAGAKILGIAQNGSTNLFSISNIRGDYKGVANADTSPGLAVAGTEYEATVGVTYPNFLSVSNQPITIPSEINGKKVLSAKLRAIDPAHWEAVFTPVDVSLPIFSEDGNTYISKNIFNKTTEDVGHFIDTDGTYKVYSGTDVSCSALIDVSELDVITVSGVIPKPVEPIANPYQFLDANGNVVSFGPMSSFPKTIAVPANAVKFRFTLRWFQTDISLLNAVQVESGNVATDFESFGTYTAITAINGKKVEAPAEYTKSGSISKNLYDKSARVSGWYVDIDGSYKQALVDSPQNFSASPAITVFGLAHVTVSGLSGSFNPYQFLDMNGSIIGFGKLSNPNTTLPIPSNAVKLRFTDKFDTSSNAVFDTIQVESGESASQYVAFAANKTISKVNGREIEASYLAKGVKIDGVDVATVAMINANINTKDKTILYDGDSISKDDRIIQYVSLKLSSTRINQAVAGTGWVDSNGQTVGSNPNNMYYRSQLIASHNPDLIVLWGGTNDFARSIPLGSPGTKTNVLTFYGGVWQTIERIRFQNPGVQILIITPVQRNNPFEFPGRDSMNNVNATLYDYVKILKEVAAQLACPVLDMYGESGITSENIIRDFANDGLHIYMTPKGVQRAGDMISSKINQLAL